MLDGARLAIDKEQSPKGQPVCVDGLITMQDLTNTDIAACSFLHDVATGNFLSVADSFVTDLAEGNYTSVAAGCPFSAPPLDMSTDDLLEGIQRATQDVWARAA